MNNKERLKLAGDILIGGIVTTAVIGLNNTVNIKSEEGTAPSGYEICGDEATKTTTTVVSLDRTVPSGYVLKGNLGIRESLVNGEHITEIIPAEIIVPSGYTFNPTTGKAEIHTVNKVRVR